MSSYAALVRASWKEGAEAEHGMVRTLAEMNCRLHVRLRVRQPRRDMERAVTYRPASSLHCRLAHVIGRIAATRMVYCTPPRHLSVGEVAVSCPDSSSPLYPRRCAEPSWSAVQRRTKCPNSPQGASIMRCARMATALPAGALLLGVSRESSYSGATHRRSSECWTA